MPRIPKTLEGLRLPVIGAPLFIVNTPQMVIAQCKEGIVGSMPSLNARPLEQLDLWLKEITEALSVKSAANAPGMPAAPFGINLIVHKTNERLDADLNLIVKYKVPIVITSLGARAEVNDAVHSYGGFVLHDVINNAFARKAIAKGADGLVAVAAGAGGHAGTKSPFALVREIRQWFDGPLALAGAISTGDDVLAAQAMGADFAYIGSAFVATAEARVSDAYKQAIVDGNSDEIVYTNLFSGVHGNYLRCSIINAGLDPDNLPVSHAGNMNWTSARQEQKWNRYAQESKVDAFEGGTPANEMAVEVAPAAAQAPAPKAWKEIWGAGHGIASITKVVTVAEYVERLSREYDAARARLLGRVHPSP